MATVGLADADSNGTNLALMCLAAYLRAQGDTPFLITPETKRHLWSPVPRDILGSSIFSASTEEREAIEREWGYVRWGGTGVRVESSLSEIDPTVDWDAVAPDYSIYPDCTASIGFLTRGCRLRCGFCVVPKKEGKPRIASSVDGVYRGAPHPRHLWLLDNDAFAAPLRDFWRGVVEEVNARRFKLCFSQGINLRLVDDEAAAMIASVHYTDNAFSKRILYTAWDNLKDERIFKTGVDRLARAGVSPKRLRVFMLVGYREGETWDDLFYRFAEIAALGAEPYVMVFGKKSGKPSPRPELDAFQRWCNWKGTWRLVAWPDYPREDDSDTRISPRARAESDAAWKRVVGRLAA